MRGLHPGEPRGDEVRKRRGLFRRHVDMQRQVLGGGRQPALLGVEQLLEIVHALGVVIEQLEGHPHRIAGMKLAQVAHMDLGGEGGMPRLLQILRAPQPISS